MIKSKTRGREMNELTKDMTMEDKAKFDEGKKVAAEAYKARKAEARETITKWIADEPKVDTKVLEAIKYLAGTGVRSVRTGVSLELRNLLEAGPVSTVDIFNKFEYGRPTMQQKINDFIKKGEPKDRIWVALADGKYSIVGRGPNPPKGWIGYLPVVKEEL
jgi:hypothetical protein